MDGTSCEGILPRRRLIVEFEPVAVEAGRPEEMIWCVWLERLGEAFSWLGAPRKLFVFVLFYTMYGACLGLVLAAYVLNRTPLVKFEVCCMLGLAVFCGC